MDTVQAAGITTVSTEECPLVVMREQWRGIYEDFADLMDYLQGQIDEKKDAEK